MLLSYRNFFHKKNLRKLNQEYCILWKLQGVLLEPQFIISTWSEMIFRTFLLLLASGHTWQNFVNLHSISCGFFSFEVLREYAERQRLDNIHFVNRQSSSFYFWKFFEIKVSGSSFCVLSVAKVQITLFSIFMTSTQTKFLCREEANENATPITLDLLHSAAFLLTDLFGGIEEKTDRQICSPL